MNPELDFFYNKDGKWQDAYKQLRMIVLDCGLSEELKWRKPCYTYKHTNIVLIHGFKEFCALLFHKGALLKDTNGILVQQTENVQAARQIRFTNVEEIAGMEATLKAYIFEAIEVEKSGLKIDFKKTKEYKVPKEFEDILKEIPELKTAFESLTPGRQRGYLLHFSQPKQSTTRISRIEKCMEQILNGKGLNDYPKS
tara:strand:- start:3645 stop:4235 length:591 start_codon:yes stop_codon:yes gene_type:complete